MPKKPEYIKTPGFIIEVPKERRKEFFVAPKSPLVYWAFKNRPRVFIKEKLIFTFGGKPVAEALVAKVEGPGKGEGEFKTWHKVYWKPVTFKRFKVVAGEEVLYHVALQKNLDDILENGLKVEYGYQFFDDIPKSTYLTDRKGLPFWKEEIASYYGDPQVVLKVNRKGLKLIPDEQGTSDAGAPAYRVEHDIPPSMIKVARHKTADHDLDTDSGETYWAGVGNAASGILPVCPQTGRVCLAWRSQYVQSPDCWGTIGGAVQQGKSPQQSAKAEMAEETGYSGGINLIPAYVFTDGEFTYHNYIGVVASEFSFSPKPLSKGEYAMLKARLRPEQYHQLQPGWETDHIEWFYYEEVVEDMKQNPGDYHPGMLDLFRNSADKIEKALKIEKQEEPQQEPEQPKTAAHSPSCACEMCRSIPAWKRPWLMGKCPEFALALSSVMPDAQFVAIGNAMFEHVGMRKDDVYYDVRGKLTKDQFAELFGSNASHVHDVDRELVMKDAYPSYIGHEDELAELPDFKQALRTVRKVFGSKTADLLPTAQPPDVRILPCPTGKKKYYDKATVLMKARGMQGTPAMAYQCPKCHWWHMTSKPQHGPNPTYKSGAGEQGELFPSSQDAKFRQWFQGSKVVDNEGRPMPVYHGTRSSVNFDTFSVDGPPQAEDSYEGETTSSGSGWDPTAFMGSHFAEEARVANQFAQGEGWTKSRYEGENEAPRVIQVFLRILNPKDFGTESNLHNFIAQGKISDDDVLGIGCRVETGYNPWEGDEQENPEAQKEIDAWYQKYENDQSFRVQENNFLLQQYRPMDMEDEMLRNAAYDLAMQARHRLEQSGVDGIRYKNEIEGGHAWIAFAPQQIKSVYSEFNPQDQRFTASVESDATEIKINPKSKGIEAEAWYEGQRVGFVYLHKMEDAPGNPRAPQNSLMVDAAGLNGALKGKSIGLKMYRAAIEAASKAGYARVYEGIEHSEDAANLWERLKQLYPTEFDEDWGIYYIPLDNVKTAAGVNPQLKTWFDGSKVVDQKGNPRVVYHGSKSKWLTQFDLSQEGKGIHGGTKWGAIWFTSSAENAEEYADTPEEKAEADLDEIAVYGNNPFYAAVYDINGESIFQVGPYPTEEEAERKGQEEAREYNKHLQENTNINAVYLRITNPYITDKVPRDAEFKAAKQGGHDGIIAYDVVDGYTVSDIFVIFDPKQAKSATRNVGTYDPANTSLTADWKRNVLLPAALTLGLGAPSTSPSEINPQQSQVEMQRRQEAEAEKVRQEQIDKLIEAISRAEGAKPERNNPGNLADFTTGEIKSFDSLEEGKEALAEQLNRIADGVHPFIKPEMTLRQAGLIYSNGDPNWAHNVSLIMRVPQSTKIGDLIKGVTQQADTGKQPSGRTGAWLKAAAGFAFKSFKKLWHVGTMNPNDKRDDSYEGAGLSVSVHPEEWSMIAKLPGDTWELVKAGNKFVNFHRLSKAQRKKIADWGVQNGYASPAELWRHSFFDDESGEEGEWRYSDYQTKAEAEAELGNYGEEKIEPVEGGMNATPKLEQKSLRKNIDPVEMMDLLVAAYAEDELDCDGVWWEDTFDPDNLSAPRGVIFPGKLKSWQKRKADLDEGDDNSDPNRQQEIKALERDIKKYGDPDGVLTEHLKAIRGSEVYLYHGTTELVAEKILLDGSMPVGSFWGTERIAATYAEEAVDAEMEYEADAEEIIIRVPLSRFNKAALKPDDNSVAEPLTYTLKRKEEDLYAEWQQSKGTWEDSLRIYESVRYDAPIQITKADIFIG